MQRWDFASLLYHLYFVSILFGIVRNVSGSWSYTGVSVLVKKLVPVYRKQILDRFDFFKVEKCTKFCWSNTVYRWLQIDPLTLKFFFSALFFHFTVLEVWLVSLEYYLQLPPIHCLPASLPFLSQLSVILMENWREAVCSSIFLHTQTPHSLARIDGI